MYPDIYFTPKWGKLNEILENGEYKEFSLNSQYGSIVYPIIKRKVPINYNNEIYYDTITPYGFNGPIITQVQDKNKLLKEFEQSFNLFCKSENIIAEYVRFSPWLQNANDFKGFYQISDNNSTFYIDLRDGEFFKNSFSSKCRNQIRKAQKSGLMLTFSFDKEKSEDFYQLYSKMIEKNNVSSYYRFKKTFIEATMDVMKDNIFTVIAYYENKPVSAAMFLYNNKYIHYHLSGNDKDYSSFCANHLIINAVSEWAYNKGIEEFHLGGVAKSESGLYHFKESFATATLPFFVGKRISNVEIYSEINTLLNVDRSSTYFPLYRQ